mgnify:CR=1 FL=1
MQKSTRLGVEQYEIVAAKIVCRPTVAYLTRSAFVRVRQALEQARGFTGRIESRSSSCNANIFGAFATRKRLRHSDFKVLRGVWMLSCYCGGKIRERMRRVAPEPNSY